MGTYDSDEPGDYGDGTRWEDTIHLLKLVQNDYQDVRKELEKVSNTLADRENLVSQRIEYALRVSGGYNTLCLVSCEVGGQTSQIGKTILGEVPQPAVLPRPMHLDVHCLGRFEVRSTWKPVERWQSVKAKSVFAYLMTKPREPFVRDILMEALWPDCDPQAAGNNLKAAMHGLRQTLHRLFQGKETFPYILYMQGSYLINPEIELWVDVEEFEQRWMLGRRLEKEGRLAEAIREYETAEALYHGDYLQDEPYEEWTLLRREALKDDYVIILGKLADHSMKTYDYESGIIYCQKILAKDPCREDAYRRLMHCYSRLGQRNRALHWYKICHQTIQTELDTTPDRETTELYHQLLKDDPI